MEVVVLLVLGAAVLAAFVAVEQRAAEPIVPLRLFKNRMVLAAVVTRFLAGMAMFGALSFVPLFLQAVTGATATRAGIVLTPFVLGWVVMSVVSARFVLRVGYRTVVLIGMASLMVAFLLFQRWSVTLSPGRAMVDVLLAGIGMGMVVVPMLIAVQSVVARSDLGAATSLTQFFMSIGGALGLSLMGAVMSQRLHAGLPMADALHGVFVVGAGVCVNPLGPAVLKQLGDRKELTCYAALIEGLTGIWNAAVRAAVVARLRASGLPPDDLLLKLGALSPTLGFAAEKSEWAREWLADPFTQDPAPVQQCVVRMLLALRTMADARAAELTTTIG